MSEWYTRYIAEVKARETAERSRDAIRAKSDRQRQAILRLTHEVERRKAERSALVHDLHKERAAAAQLREALVESRARWEAMEEAKRELREVGEARLTAAARRNAQVVCAGRKARAQ